MKKVIDFKAEMERRFYDWAAEYVGTQDGSDIRQFQVGTLLNFLVKENVFTVNELRNELRECHISIDEKYFEVAEKVAEERNKK